DRRAREDARQGRGLLRRRGRRSDPVADLDRRAADDDPGGIDGRRDRDRDVLADVQDALARQVTPRTRLFRHALSAFSTLPTKPQNSAEGENSEGERPMKRRLLIAVAL